MPSLKFFFNNKRFLCIVLVLAAGSLSLLMIVSHAAWNNNAPVAYESHPDMGVTLEIDKVISGSLRTGVSLEGFPMTQARLANYDVFSGTIGGYKSEEKETAPGDRAVWMNQFSVLSDKNHFSKENTVNKASNSSQETGSSDDRETIAEIGISYIDPDLDSGINKQNNLNVHTLSSSEMRSNSHTELAAAEASPSPAPEPATMILVGSGLVFLTTIVRKKNRNGK